MVGRGKGFSGQTGKISQKNPNGPEASGKSSQLEPNGQGKKLAKLNPLAQRGKVAKIEPKGTNSENIHKKSYKFW